MSKRSFRTEPTLKNGVIYERMYEVELYPDSTSYNCLDLLSKLDTFGCDYAYILHNKDKAEMPVLLNPDDRSLKKPHYHVFIRFENARSINSVANLFGVPSQFVQWKSDEVGSIQYLIHLNHKDKYQYDKSEVVTNIPDIDKYLSQSKQLAEDDAVIALISLIQSCGYIELEDFILLVCRQHLYSYFRRSAVTFIKILERHNSLYAESCTIPKSKQKSRLAPVPGFKSDSSIDFQ